MVGRSSGTTDTVRFFACGYDGYVYISDIQSSGNFNNPVETRVDGITHQLNGMGAFGINNAIAVGEEGTILYTTDGNIGHEADFVGTSETLYGVMMANQSLAVAAGKEGVVLKSTDGGVTWVSLVSNSNVFGGYDTFKYHSVAFIATSATTFDADKIYLCASDGLSESAVWYSSDISDAGA